MPKVTVIIPVYNVESYLRECLDSVVNQTLSDIEIICVDDGSTDASLAILKEYAAKDNRFVIKRQKNKHAGVARNNGLKSAHGEFIHFLDADDWIDVNAYEKLYNILKNSDADMVKFKAYSYNQEENKVTTRAYLDMKHVDNQCFESTINIITDAKNTVKLMDSPWSGFYRRDFLKKNKIYFDNFIVANDVGFFYRCIVNAQKVYVSSERLIYYREKVSNSLVTKRIKYFNCQIALYDVVDKVSRKLPPDIRSITLNEIYSAVWHWYKKGITKYNLTLQEAANLKKEIYKFLNKVPTAILDENNLQARESILSILNKEYDKQRAIRNQKRKEFTDKIFSIQNVGIHKVVFILGLKFKFKSKDLIYEEEIKKLEKEIKKLKKKLETKSGS
ncbi:glycosyltransferase family 2 protein [bacterium]|nr:glycosyltransferase family 2 protein [bacterium]